MPNLLDLANELLLAIASHIPRSADKLQLLCVNRRLYGLMIQQLCKHILLDQTRRFPNKGGLTQIDPDECWDTRRLRRLCSVLEKKHPSRELVVESLCLELDSNTLHVSFALSNITLYLPSLKSLCLSSKRSTSSKGGPKPFPLSLAVIKHRLREVSTTLESLIIDIDQDIQFRDGTGIGGLGFFHALKHLSIQSHILLGECGDRLINSQSDDEDITYDETRLAWSLPPGLQKLQVSCWTDGYDEDEHFWGRVIAMLLRYLIEWGLDTVTELRDITVYYPIKHDGAYDVENGFPIRLEDPELEDDKMEFMSHAAEGRWQEAANMLTEMALKEHRNVAVKFEQGSQEGSRSWGETATECAGVGLKE